MALKPTNKAISLVLDTAYYEDTIKPAARDQDLSANQLIRRAITQYIDGIPRDHRLAKIISVYEKLNDEGKAWLYECAQVAIGDTNLKA